LARILLFEADTSTGSWLNEPTATVSFNLHTDSNNAQERRPMMDLVYVLAIIGFFSLCVAYTHAFDRI
jgi:hypothetical protein